jgi:hypothetical protein
MVRGDPFSEAAVSALLAQLAESLRSSGGSSTGWVGGLAAGLVGCAPLTLWAARTPALRVGGAWQRWSSDYSSVNAAQSPPWA